MAIKGIEKLQRRADRVYVVEESDAYVILKGKEQTPNRFYKIFPVENPQKGDAIWIVLESFHGSITIPHDFSTYNPAEARQEAHDRAIMAAQASLYPLENSQFKRIVDVSSRAGTKPSDLVEVVSRNVGVSGTG